MKLEDEGILELNDEEMDILSKEIDAKGHAEVIKSEIFRCSRSAKQGQIVRSNSNTEASILVQNYREGLLHPPNQFSLDFSKSSVEYKIPLRNVISLKEPESRSYSRILRSLYSTGGVDGGYKSRNYLFFELLNLLDSQNLLTSGKALYLPAERVGLANNYRTFVSSALQESIDSSLLQASGVNLDFVKKLLDIPDSEDRRQRSQEAISMEKNLIKGKVTVERDSFNIPQFSYDSEELSEKLPLNMTSSMVSQIAPVVLFLRYYGKSHRVLEQNPFKLTPLEL